jgi:hypothetical protein
MDHPPYNSNVTHRDFSLSGPVKKHLAGKQFATDTDMKQAVTSWLQTLDTNFFHIRIQALVP